MTDTYTAAEGASGNGIPAVSAELERDPKDYFEQVISYSRCHYLPLLSRLRNNEAVCGDDRRLIGFLYDDFSKLLDRLEAGCRRTDI